MNQKINIKVYGKWILAGEYIVLNRYPALAFSLFSRFIELEYQKTTQDLIIVNKHSSDKNDISKKDFFISILNQALQNVSRKPKDIKGIITLNFNMFFSAGMGASAVICVLIARLFDYLDFLKQSELFIFCHSLENKLHGKSSGLDIAATLTEKPILYQWKKNIKTPSIKIFSPVWKPLIFLSYCGKGESTKANIKKMQIFLKKDPKQAHILNKQMEKAVLEAKKGLSIKKDKGLSSLVTAFCLAETCFEKWNLIGSDMKEHIAVLKNQGALAVKPTGSGSGGCVLSLWSQQPPSNLRNQLIFAF